MTNATTITSEEKQNAERFRRLLLSTSAAVVRVAKNDKGDVVQITIEASKGAKSTAPLRSDIINALDAMLEMEQSSRPTH